MGWLDSRGFDGGGSDGGGQMVEGSDGRGHMGGSDGRGQRVESQMAGSQMVGSDVYRRFFFLLSTTLHPDQSQPVTRLPHSGSWAEAFGKINRDSHLKNRKLQSRDSESVSYEPWHKYHPGSL